MTREDARYYLQSSGFSEEQIDTIEQAFKQEPTEKPMCDRNICISNEYNGIGCDKCIVNKVEQEPNIDMESDEIKILQKRSYLEGFHEALKMSVKQEPCDDAISRKAVLDTTICEGISCNECSFNEIDGESGCLLHARIDELPSVTHKSGEWIKGKCDQCGEHAPFWSMSTTYYESEYCPNCGAKMESEDKG